jgi:hypothetical protein
MLTKQTFSINATFCVAMRASETQTIPCAKQILKTQRGKAKLRGLTSCSSALMKQGCLNMVVT